MVQSVNPHIPDDFGDTSTTFNIMFIMTRHKTTNIPIRPGYAVGGMRKLNQLIETIIVVGRNV